MGKVTHGSLTAKEGEYDGQSVEFMFNPTEYTVSKTNTWTWQNKKTGNVPHWDFGGGEPRQLQLELFFDTSLPNFRGGQKNVRKLTNMLFAFMMIDKRLKDKAPHSKIGRPPECLLEWGRDTKFQFKCYITNCTVKYTLFTEDGVPIRATATLTLKEVADPKDLPSQNPTSAGDPGRRVHVVTTGDRLDWIAYKEYGDANAWRRIAEANRLFNPLNLKPGMVLTIPPL
ncbi:MAG: LysM peptidoglycan-binding domain-containing protein [Anaerolineae bacterium]